MAPNKSLIFTKIPTAAPIPGEHLVVETREIDLDTVPSGGLIVEILYASFDPYLRGRMRDESIKSYIPAFTLNEPMGTKSVARVLKSDNPDYKPGDLVNAYAPISQYARFEGAALEPSMVSKIENPHNLDLGLFLGPLGLPGLTAWAGLYKIGKPKHGETLFVSSAAGAVGQVVGQVAKREGLTVIGSVGDDKKRDFIMNELGFDGAFNYKTEKPIDGLRRLAPNGIDIYFENVGGDHLEAALETMNEGGRIVACGMISDYNTPMDQRKGIKNLMFLVSKQITMQGFIVSKPGFGPAYSDDHQKKMQDWLADGSVKAKLHVTDGIDGSAEAFVGMLRGENFGKAVLKIGDETAGSKI